MAEKVEFYVEVIYNDDSFFDFTVTFEDSVCKPLRKSSYMASLSMIVRGTLMASSARRATAYDSEGFDVCSYVR